MVQTWFISDTHFNHAKIIEYSKRPFKDVDEMNRTLIKNWNERIKKDDTVYFLGDFCFVFKGSPKAEHWISQLNGRIVFIKGNHDENNTLKTDIHSLLLDKNERFFYLVHKPEDGETGMINIVGHVHAAWKFKTFQWDIGHTTDCINVGVDVWSYRPVNFNEMMKEYKKWKNETK